MDCSHEDKNTIGSCIYNQTNTWFGVLGDWPQGVLQEQAACSWYYSFYEQMTNYYQYSYLGTRHDYSITRVKSNIFNLGLARS